MMPQLWGRTPGNTHFPPSTPYGNSTAGNLQTTLGRSAQSAQCVFVEDRDCEHLLSCTRLLKTWAGGNK